MNDGKRYILAVDLGTSGPKVSIVTTSGEVVAHETEKTKLYLLPDCGVEQDPDEWWDAIRRATLRLLSRDSRWNQNIVAIGCTSQWAGTVAVDCDGNALMKAMIWMDARGAPCIKKLVGGPIEVSGYGIQNLMTWIRLTGAVPGLSGKDPIAHILYIQQAYPDVYKKTYKFLEPLDYLNMRLTGKFAASFHSITMHWLTDNRNLDRVDYSPKLLKAAGISREKLPDLMKGTQILGAIKSGVATEFGLSPDVQVIMGAPDLHASAIGSGSVRPYTGNLYIGTSSWITCHVPFKKTDVFHSVGSFPAAVPGYYLVINEQETAGACLDYLRDKLLFPDWEQVPGMDRQAVYNRLEELAKAACPGCDGLMFTPWLVGERTPVDDHLLRGGFFNLSLHHGRAHLVRSVMEGVANNTRWLLGHVERFIGRPLERIHISGGGANSAVWCQIMADVLNRPIYQISEPIQATARGAALLAAVALDYLTLEEVDRQVKIETLYEPDPDLRQLYDCLFHEFLQLYRRNKGIYHRLNRRAHDTKRRTP